MKTHYKITDKDGIYFLTSTTLEWIPIFTRQPYFDILTQSLSFCQINKQLKIYAYVIMDNHFHLIAQQQELSRVMQDFKSFTAKKVIQQLKNDKKEWVLNWLKYYKLYYKKESEYQIWQEGFQPKLITSEDILKQKIEYIHNNPVKAGFVAKPEHWVYSSASNYLLGEGILEIDRYLF